MGEAEGPGRRRRRVLRIGLIVLGVLVLGVGGSVTWTYIASGGHRYEVTDAPDAPVVIVFGAKLYGVQRALLVTQSYHLPRAVALCRNLGMDADGVSATCDCTVFSLVKNRAREWLATVGAVREAIWNRAPAVTS